jgi:hypothetical protein
MAFIRVVPKLGFISVLFSGLLVFTVGCNNVNAQSAGAALTGTVKDASTKAAIEGATVSLLGLPDVVATTDANGAFSISLAAPVKTLTAYQQDRHIRFQGSRLSFATSVSGDIAQVTLHDLLGHQVSTLLNARLTEGDYVLSMVPARLSPGLYLVRAQIGNQVASYKLSILGNVRATEASGLRKENLSGNGAGSENRAALVKAAAAIGGVDFLVVTKTGYLKKHHEVMALTDVQAVTLETNTPATSNLKIFTDSDFPQIDWANAAIYSWEQTAVLTTDSTSIGFGGSVAAMKVASLETAGWNGWAFHVAKLANGTQPTADLSPYAEGSLHLAVKGNAKSIGVMISSPNQGAGSAPLVDLATKGYLPDSAWHEISIPVSEFSGTLDLSQIFVYCGFVSPVAGGVFDPLDTYLIDDVYFIPKK